MTTPIETAFADLCAKHDLVAAQVGMNMRQSEEHRFDAAVFWDDPSNLHGMACAQTTASTAQEALASAIVKANEDRMPTPPEVPALTIAEAA